MFQAQSGASTPNIKESLFNKFSAQPHQPFFFNGLLLLIICIALISLSYMNKISLEVSLNIYHAYALVFVVFVQFFLGFLFVVFPRFLMQAEISKKVYMQQYALYLLGSVVFIASLFISQSLTLLASLILLVAQISSFKILYGIHTASLMKEKYDTKWVLISFLTGLISHGFFIISLFFEGDLSNTVQTATLYAGFYLFIFALIFTISQRMVPFFTSMKVQGYAINKSKYLMEMIFSLLIIKVAILTLGMTQLNIFADLPLLILFTRELIKWKLPLTKVVPIMWVLYVSIYWIPLGFLLSSIESLSALLGYGAVFEKSALHIFAIGYFITILLGFGTRVVLGHSGRTPTADKFTTALFVLVQVVVLLRLLAGVSINFEMDYVFWINMSAHSLVLLLIIWAIKYLPILIKLK